MTPAGLISRRRHIPLVTKKARREWNPAALLMK